MFARIVIVGAGKTSEAIVDRLSHVAPLVVLDKSEAALESLALPDSAALDGRFRHAVVTRAADGTSRLVLQDARGQAAEHVALLAATGDDRVNLEVCRLAKELRYRPVAAIAIDPRVAPHYESLGANAIVRPAVLAQVVERALQFEGLAMATTVGQGKGEILEFTVLPSSTAIGVPLREIDANGWRVAAIYRGEKLVVPTGSTTVEADDRVVVVGDPRVLPLVAENLRIGLPMFPLRYGARVVVLLPRGPDREIEAEGEVLLRKTRASGLVRVFPGAKAQLIGREDSSASELRSTESAQKTFEDRPLEGQGTIEQVRCLLGAGPGVVVTRAVRRTLWQRALGSAGRDGALCDSLPCPVIFPRGGVHYRRVVFAITADVGDLPTAETAIDLARMLDLHLEVIRVDLPSYIAKNDERLDVLVKNVERRARLHQVRASVSRLEGNPIERFRTVAHTDDLIVATRRRGARDSFTNPDFALRITHQVECSTLVATIGDD